MKNIIVTGGARGIGKAIVEELSKSNYNIILNYNKSQEEAKQIKQNNKNVEIYRADVTKREHVEKMINWVVEKYNKIDVLVNNAGISQIKPFANITEEDWDNMIQTNLKSVFYTCKAVMPNMLKYKDGLIINISSIWGIIGASCEVHYSTAKAGVNGFTKSLAKELRSI